MTGLMIACFFFLMLIGTPLFAALLASAAAGLVAAGEFSLLTQIPQQFFGGMSGFTLMAVPLFVFAGSLMNQSGLTDRLVRFTRTLVGHFRGGLGHVNILASILFAGVNGSAAADTSALGSVLIPAMAEEGYDRSYAAGLTAGSSLIGPIIPPSIFMILYGNMTNTSVGGLFAAGIIPGIVLGAAFMMLNGIRSRMDGVPKQHKRAGLREMLRALRFSLPALAAPLIILGGIVFGVFTPTESGAAASAFILAAGFWSTRELTLRKVWTSVLESARLTSTIFLIIGAAAAVGWVLTYQRVPAQFAELVSGLLSQPLLVLLVLSGITFVFGMFMEEIASLVLLTPIFAPAALEAGIDPYHFGIIMVLNITIALITPPMGGCLFIASAVGKVELSALFRNIWPFVVTALCVLLVIIAVPGVTTALPRLFGF